MHDSHHEVGEERNPQAALEMGSVSSVEFDKVCPLLPPSRPQRRKGNHGGRWVAIRVEATEGYGVQSQPSPGPINSCVLQVRLHVIATR